MNRRRPPATAAASAEYVERPAAAVSSTGRRGHLPAIDAQRFGDTPAAVDRVLDAVDVVDAVGVAKARAFACGSEAEAHRAPVASVIRPLRSSPCKSSTRSKRWRRRWRMKRPKAAAP